MSGPTIYVIKNNIKGKVPLFAMEDEVSFVWRENWITHEAPLLERYLSYSRRIQL